MDTESLITLLREEIEKLGNKCYSPDLPQNDELCSAISLGTGTNQRALSDDILYSDIPVYILIRGTYNDTDTRKLADAIFNQLDHKSKLKKNNTYIILISCDTPNYAFRDENQRIYYNINVNIKVEWRNE